MLDLIKGRRVEDALNTLAFSKKRIAAKVEKLVRSAVENANYLSTEKNVDVDLDSLYVKHAVANDGPRMKRIRPAPMGRAFRYVRRIAHIEIALADIDVDFQIADVGHFTKTGGKAVGKGLGTDRVAELSLFLENAPGNRRAHLHTLHIGLGTLKRDLLAVALKFQYPDRRVIGGFVILVRLFEAGDTGAGTFRFGLILETFDFAEHFAFSELDLRFRQVALRLS